MAIKYLLSDQNVADSTQPHHSIL